ncbi:helix-turn-helix domain-containing protein [Facklamia sp. P12955]|uniref:helix-turn-helix domain-containing protein n=1 Tax=Facklamia sp. P12955 TaxID=3421946 RepID=UPI003D17E038
MYGEKGLRKSVSKTKYSGELKKSVIKYRQYNELSYRETAEYFKINNPSIIANWKRKYKQEGFERFNANEGKPIKNGDTTMSKNTDKSNEIKKLKKSKRRINRARAKK